MPLKQQADLCAYTLLALADIKETDDWTFATNHYIRIHDVLQFIAVYYKITYAENSRETFRKQAMHPFIIAAIIEDNGKATNSPLFRYRLTDEALHLIRSFNTPEWEKDLSIFNANHDTLAQRYSQHRLLKQMPIKINGAIFALSTGSHNELQKAIVDDFAARFAQGSMILYIGDTRDKNLFKDIKTLYEIGVQMTEHDKLPDVVLYQPDKKWVFFIEAVTSVGPMSPKRIIEIEDITKECGCGKIYVTAFPDIKTYKKFASDLAWETEVWIADNPDHMIHLNGDKFLGPRQ